MYNNVFEVCWDILSLICYKFTDKSGGEKALKIGQQLAKL